MMTAIGSMQDLRRGQPRRLMMENTFTGNQNHINYPLSSKRFQYFSFQCQPISNSGYLIVIQDTLVIIWFVCSCLIFHIVINSGLRVSIIKFPKFICKIIGASKQTNFDKSLKIPMVLQVYFRMVVTNEKQIFTGIERIINHEKYRSQTIIQIIWSTTNISCF